MPSLQLIDASFGKDADAEVETFVHENLDYLINSYRQLHSSMVPRWRKIYMGTPAQANKSFPWPNASNVIVQVVGELVDSLAARVLGLLYATHPLFAFRSFNHQSANPDMSEKQRRTLEDFMDAVGYEPSELDLYPIEYEWFTDAAKLGTAYTKVSIEHNVEAIVVGYSSAAKKKTVEFEERTIYQGPRVSKLRFEDVLVDPAVRILARAGFVSHRRTLKRRELEERMFIGIYDKKAVEDILSKPDRQAPREGERDEQQQAGFTARGIDDTTAEWDIYECYFPWWHNGKKHRLIYSYHHSTRTTLRRVFNFMPDHELPLLVATVGHRGDGLLGHGLAEALEGYQEAISTINNQRIDNSTVANIRAIRISPRARYLDTNFEWYPGCTIVAEKDEAEPFQVGDVYSSSFQNEEMLLRHTQSRAGIEPAIAGMGTGGITKRPSVYSAGGTLAVMQENNGRVSLVTSSFRHAHVKLGGLLTSLYAKFGTNGREAMFGMDAKNLTEALKEYERHHLRIPIRAATASMNREVEKQADMILVGLMQRHYTAVGQLLQAINNPMLPPGLKDYLNEVIRASNGLIRRVLKDFGYDDPDQFVPEAKLEGAGGGQLPPGAAPPLGGGGQMAPAGPSVEAALEAAIPRGAGLVPPVGGGPVVPRGGA